MLGGTAIVWRNLISLWRPRFDEHTAQTVTSVTDTMFPGDGLPGATELGISDRIVAMPDLHSMMIDAVDWLDTMARGQGAANFLGLDASGKSAVVGAAFESADEDVKQFALTIRYYGALNYYSAPAIRAAFAYTGPPQPQGFPDFQSPPAKNPPQ